MSWLTDIHVGGSPFLKRRERKWMGREGEAGGGTGKRGRREGVREENCDWAGKIN